jgi:amino acid permease
MGSYRPHAIFAPKKGVLADLGFRLSFYIFCYSGQLRPTLYLTGSHYTFVDSLGLALLIAMILCPFYLIVMFILGEYDAEKLEQQERAESTKEDDE